MKNYPSVGVQSPDILLPRDGIDLNKWAVIACDQFTSQPEYWRQVESHVGDQPSTLNLILPEAFLCDSDDSAVIRKTQAAMQLYLNEKVFQVVNGMVLVERTFGGKTRRGIVLALDLEHYDYTKTSQSLIRATEGTIIERLPPRVKIREGAVLELPHILVLIDDPEETVIEPVIKMKDSLNKVYDFDLMLGSGHLKGYAVEPALEKAIIAALEKLADPEVFHQKYDLKEKKSTLLFAMGDGNHSLATAKAVWEKRKAADPNISSDHPSRYALVEVENVHDRGLEFEPIHRVLFGVDAGLQKAMETCFAGYFSFKAVANYKALKATVDQVLPGLHRFGVIMPSGYAVAEVSSPSCNLPVGTLQDFIDNYLKQNPTVRIDYVHGDDVLDGLGKAAGNTGFYLPCMPKNDLFKTVVLDGSLPRKTFSMGEAREKRFYMECRRID
ncbi:MAG: DUF1015 domain-containing protein [Anaerolineaceae bacterium]